MATSEQQSLQSDKPQMIAQSRVDILEAFVVSQNERALTLFLHYAAKRPGVVRTSRHCAEGRGGEGVMVIVSNLSSTVTHEVLRAQERVYDAIPGIRFGLEITDVSTI